MQPTKGLFGGPVPRFARTCLNDSGAFALFEKKFKEAHGVLGALDLGGNLCEWASNRCSRPEEVRRPKSMCVFGPQVKTPYIALEVHSEFFFLGIWHCILAKAGRTPPAQHWRPMADH